MSKGVLLPVTALALSSALLTARQLLIPLVQGGPDWLGVSRTIDHAVYTGLNALAIILWRLNSAIMSMSLFSYSTQDWLTDGADGGVWQVMDLVIGPGGLFGLEPVEYRHRLVPGLVVEVLCRGFALQLLYFRLQ